jgi:LacI family transcriptional regulator
MRMKPMPDGLFITSDLAAAMCMHALKESGVRVPEDIAIVGFNNDPVGRLITPTLTTIDYPGFEIGKTAAISLLQHLSGRRSMAQSTTAIVPSGLIVRGSSVRGCLS